MLITPINNNLNSIKYYKTTANTIYLDRIPATLKSDSFVSSLTFKGVDSLHDYAQGGHLSCVKQKIEEGANVNYQDINGDTPLFLACMYGRIYVVEELLKHPNINVNLANKAGFTPLMTACSHNEDEVVRKLLEREEIDINATTNSLNYTALIRACIEGNNKIVNMLLDHPDIDTTIKGPLGTAYEAEGNHLDIETFKRLKEITEYQLAHPKSMRKRPVKIDINKLSPEENIWTTKEITENFKKLVVGGKYSEASEFFGRTPLIIINDETKDKVCQTMQTEFIEKFFDYKFNKQKPMLKEYEQKRKIFIEKTIKNLSYDKLKENNVVLNTLDGFKILLSKPEFNPNDIVNDKSLFEYACAIDSQGEFVKSILAKYDDVFVNNAKKTKNEVIKTLIENYEKEGKFKVKLENIKSKFSNQQSREAAVESLNEFVSSDNYKPEMTDNVGNDVLHIISAVASDGSREIIQKVLDKGGNIDSLNIGNQTPIMAAIKSLMIVKTEDEKSSILSNIKFLLDKGANVDAKDLNDQTVFHYVCRTMSTALLMMFLAKSPNVFIKDKYGNRAAKYLQSQEMKDIYQKYIMG